MNFSDKLQKLRKDKHITREQLSKATGISKGSISSYELGRRKPKIENISILANYFDVTIEYLKDDNDMELDASSQYVVRELNLDILEKFSDFCLNIDETTLDRIHTIIMALMKIYESKHVCSDDKVKIFAILAQNTGLTAEFADTSISQKTFSKLYLDSLNEIMSIDTINQNNTQSKTTKNVTDCDNGADEQEQHLLSNYKKLTEQAKHTLVDYSDFMISKPENLKEPADTDQMIS
ncbi:MAG: helix-turn-helix transcriptional regulator [Clostridia bacterium]|nr:helix-turn-helix transcriptional regulator [Clostridia bacterium]